MRRGQKQLLIGGVILILASLAYLTTAPIPQTRTHAILFPLSILGTFFGIIGILWGATWIALEHFDYVG